MLETNATSLEALLAQVALGSRDAFDALIGARPTGCSDLPARAGGTRGSRRRVARSFYHGLAQSRTIRRHQGQCDHVARHDCPQQSDRPAALHTRPAGSSQCRAGGGAGGSGSIAAAAGTGRHGSRAARELPGATRAASPLAHPRRFFDGLTYEDLATKIETPLGTIKSWIRRG